MPVPFSGQVTVSGTAQQLDSSNKAVNVSAFIVRAPVANAHTVYIGGSGVTSSTGHGLEPGNEIVYGRFTQQGETQYQHVPSDFYVVGTGPDVVTWLALV